MSSFRGRPFARTLRGGSTAGGSGGGILAGSGSSGSMLVRSIIPNWAGGGGEGLGISAGLGHHEEDLELAGLALVGHIARRR